MELDSTLGLRQGVSKDLATVVVNYLSYFSQARLNIGLLISLPFLI